MSVSEHVQEDQGTAAGRRRWPGWTGPAVVAGGLLAASAYVFANDPSGGGAFIPCVFHEMTGLWCPGCGLTRATHHLLHLDLAGALSRNLFLPVVVGVVVWAWLAWTLQSTGRPARGPNKLPARFWAIVGIGIVVFGVVRNLPFGASLAP